MFEFNNQYHSQILSAVWQLQMQTVETYVKTVVNETDVKTGQNDDEMKNFNSLVFENCLNLQIQLLNNINSNPL